MKSETYPKDIKKLLELAKERNASDVHITVGYPPIFRIDGKLVHIGTELINPEMAEKLIFPTLAESKRDLLEVNREVDVAFELEAVARFRINVYHEKGRLAAAFRIIPQRIKTLEELNLPKILRRFTKLNQGFVLITGPTGHGKTTTLASMLQEINKNYEKHIITIEDPIEYVYPRAMALVSQREMHEDTHSWEIALRSAMREDPDVVLVGEMRDFETISSAITLAETGHLVFATLHTNSSSQTIDRIIDTFPDNQQRQIRTQLASIIEGVISQRLIPVRTGGRRPVCEVLLSTPAVKNLIREGKIYQIDNVIRTSLDVGMTSMENSLVQLVREGLISVEQAEEYAIEPEEVIRLLR
ncbi:MAG: type IV pilus twitching motility protein PilT [bacterium]